VGASWFSQSSRSLGKAGSYGRRLGQEAEHLPSVAVAGLSFGEIVAGFATVADELEDEPDVGHALELACDGDQPPLGFPIGISARDVRRLEDLARLFLILDLARAGGSLSMTSRANLVRQRSPRASIPSCAARASISIPMR
jgi:hypothetical protein